VRLEQGFHPPAQRLVAAAGVVQVRLPPGARFQLERRDEDVALVHG
jgi:hypothetical protein